MYHSFVIKPDRVPFHADAEPISATISTLLRRTSRSSESVLSAQLLADRAILKNPPTSAARTTLEAKEARGKAKMKSNNQADRRAIPHARELLDRLAGWKQPSNRKALSQETTHWNSENSFKIEILNGNRRRTTSCGGDGNKRDLVFDGDGAPLLSSGSSKTAEQTRSVSTPARAKTTKSPSRPSTHQPAGSPVARHPNAPLSGPPVGSREVTASRWGYSRIKLLRRAQVDCPQKAAAPQEVIDSDGSRDEDRDGIVAQSAMSGDTGKYASTAGERPSDNLLTKPPSGFLLMRPRRSSAAGDLMTASGGRESGGSPSSLRKDSVYPDQVHCVRPSHYGSKAETQCPCSAGGGRAARRECTNNTRPQRLSQMNPPEADSCLVGVPRAHVTWSNPGSRVSPPMDLISRTALGAMMGASRNQSSSSMPRHHDLSSASTSLSMPLLRLCAQQNSNELIVSLQVKNMLK